MIIMWDELDIPSIQIKYENKYNSTWFSKVTFQLLNRTYMLLYIDSINSPSYLHLPKRSPLITRSPSTQLYVDQPIWLNQSLNRSAEWNSLRLYTLLLHSYKFLCNSLISAEPLSCSRHAKVVYYGREWNFTFIYLCWITILMATTKLHGKEKVSLWRWVNIVYWHPST